MASKLTQGCQVCGSLRERQTFQCVQCNDLSFCYGCWDQWVLHAPGAAGWGGKTHEKVDPIILKRLRQVFEPMRTEAEHEDELERDRETTWFGFDRDSSGQPSLVDYGRYATMMAESLRDRTDERFPQLVSFIGETGVGKSTLIKLLIDRQDTKARESSRYWSPVTSSKWDYVPTTGDVHLYADPSTFFGDRPLLLADCEGLNGGEALPKALRRDAASTTRPSRSITRSTSPQSAPAAHARLASAHSFHRSIVWAKTPRMRKREYAIQYLYPKVLYTFSDCIVFVTRNPRSFESTVLDKLVSWGAKSLDRSLNQPILPHAIIIFNATDCVDKEEWEPKKTTDILMDTISGAISREPALGQYATEWEKRGKKIDSTKQLLECYYETITVIRMPSRGSYLLMDRQSDRLMNLIKDRCAQSFESKKQLRLLANAERMQVYLQSAFDHFTRDLNTPFDFVKVALRHHPVARGFEGNILRLAVSIKNNAADEGVRKDVTKIFFRLSPMIASCVMLDAARQNLLGTASQLLKGAYSQLCSAALETFADSHWPCEFKSPVHVGNRGKCYNMKNSHTKGHQNVNGSVIGDGRYQTALDIQAFLPRWIEAIRSQLDNLLNVAYRLGQKMKRTDAQIAAILHRERMSSFYISLGDPAHFTSQTACFACLRQLPECPLPCGHVLCISCVEAYGRRTSRTDIELTRCPLHVQQPFPKGPHTLTLKPHRAGVRILSLDGGGVGVMVELLVLRAIQKVLGAKLPIGEFFDLIVGTGASGFVALGLGTEGWSVDESILAFKDTVRKALRPRDLSRPSFLGDLASLFYGSHYRTKSLDDAIMERLPESRLFGARGHLSQGDRKVAVVCSSPLAQDVRVMANYNRPARPDISIDYKFLRPDQRSEEVRIWEAARASLSRPRFFKPFLNTDTNEYHVDGSDKCACPAPVAHREARLIWNDVPAYPDILLSLGKGTDIRETNTTLLGRLSQLARKSSENNSIQHVESQPTSLFRPKKARRSSHHFDYDGDGEEMWNKFIASAVTPDEQEIMRRFIRVSPALRIDAPSFDGVEQLEALEQDAEEAISHDSIRIKEIGHRLIATSFFFEKGSNPVKRVGGGFYTCPGSLCCRFQQGSDELKGLGDFLRSCLKGSFEPYFLIEDEYQSGSPAAAVLLTEGIIRSMRHGYFDLKHLEIKIGKEHVMTKISLCLQTVPYASGATSLPISGFPRQLLGEEDTYTASLATHSVLLNNTLSPGRQDTTAADAEAQNANSGYVILRNKTPLSSSELTELPETTAPTPELPGIADAKPGAIFELEDPWSLA